MSLIVWNNDMSVGVPSIDEQHKKLVSMINDLYEASQEGREVSVIKETLGRLIAYTNEHFQYEEMLFDKTQYPKAQEHRSEHRALTQSVREMEERFQRENTKEACQEMLAFLVRWLMDHTMGSDKLYSQHLVSAGIQ